MPVVTQVPIIDLTDQTIRLFYFQTGLAFFISPVQPEGVIFAAAGSKCVVNTDGSEYQKTTPSSVNTGWVRTQTSAVAAARIVQSDTVTTGNVGAGLDQLHVTTAGLGSNTLQANGDYVEIYTVGLFANNANTKRYVINIAGIGANVIDTGPVVITNRFYECRWRITRISNVLVRCSANLLPNNAAGIMPVTVGNVTVATPDLNANSIFPQSLGESGAGTSDDILENLWEVTSFRFVAS